LNNNDGVNFVSFGIDDRPKSDITVNFNDNQNNPINILKLIIYVRENTCSVPKCITAGNDIAAEHIHVNDNTQYHLLHIKEFGCSIGFVIATYRSTPIADSPNIDAVDTNISIKCQKSQKNPKCRGNNQYSSSVISNINANGIAINPTNRSAKANDAI